MKNLREQVKTEDKNIKKGLCVKLLFIKRIILVYAITLTSCCVAYLQNILDFVVYSRKITKLLSRYCISLTRPFINSVH